MTGRRGPGTEPVMGTGSPLTVPPKAHTSPFPEKPARTSKLRALGARPVVTETREKGRRRGAHGPEVFNTPPPRYQHTGPVGMEE